MDDWNKEQSLGDEIFNQPTYFDKAKKKIFYLVSLGDFEGVKKLLEDRIVEPNVRLKKTADSLLHHAISHNQIDMFYHLVNMGVPVHLKNNNGDTPLHFLVKYYGVYQTKYAVVKSLLMGCKDFLDINAKNKNGDTPLHLACAELRPNLVEDLLEGGADVNVQNNEGHTPFHALFKRAGFTNSSLVERANSYWDEHVPEMRKLYDLEGVYYDGVRPSELGLRFYNDYGWFLMDKCVSLLLEAQPSLNLKDNKDYSCLQMACLNGHLKYYDLMKSKGAKLTNVSTEEGVFAIHHRPIEYLQRLLDNGLDVDARDKNGVSLLRHVFKSGNTYKLELMMRRGASIEILGFDGMDDYDYAYLNYPSMYYTIQECMHSYERRCRKTAKMIVKQIPDIVQSDWFLRNIAPHIK